MHDDDDARVLAQQFLAHVLEGLDPMDSDIGLAMFEWLIQSGRIRQIGTLNGGVGYIYHYSEPRDATRPGYTPGGNPGVRMDDAVASLKASGVKPKQIGMCTQCTSVVFRMDDGTIVTNDNQRNPKCGRGGGTHQIVY